MWNVYAYVTCLERLLACRHTNLNRVLITKVLRKETLISSRISSKCDVDQQEHDIEADRTSCHFSESEQVQFDRTQFDERAGSVRNICCYVSV